MSAIEETNQSVQIKEENNFYAQSTVKLSHSRNSMFFHATAPQSQTAVTSKTVVPVNRNPQGEKN